MHLSEVWEVYIHEGEKMNILSVTGAKTLAELVAEERRRQEELHPVPFASLLPEGEIPADHKRKLARYRSVNDLLEE